jgi:hypothetical protein
MIYEEILQSEAWRALPNFARSLYTAIAAQYRGSNNGNLDFTVSKARTYGISNKHLAAGIPLLEHVGLIEKTRQGHLAGGKKLCSLYALSCWPVEASETYDHPLKLQRPASNGWARWVKPPNWAQIVRAAKRRAAGRNFQTPYAGNALYPHAGNGKGHFRPSLEEQHGATATPHAQDTGHASELPDSARGE